MRKILLFISLFPLLSAGVEKIPPSVRILIKSSEKLSLEGKDLEILDPFSFSPLFQPFSGRLNVTGDESGIRINGKPLLKNYLILRSRSRSLEVDGRIYPGKTEIVLHNGILYLINDIDIETYVKGVVASEVPSNWEIEALKAQAVAARTYAYNLVRKNRESLYDLSASVLHQVYNGIQHASPQIVIAVESTRGEILTYEGEIIEPYYHSHCGGKTESSLSIWGKPAPYLQSVDCYHRNRMEWEMSISKAKLASLLGMAHMKEWKILRRSHTGRVLSLYFSDGKKKKIVSGEDLRKILGYSRLKSTLFWMDEKGDSIIIKGAGMGHGVGMCQHGAQELAKRGYTYIQILSHYYRGVKILKIY